MRRWPLESAHFRSRQAMLVIPKVPSHGTRIGRRAAAGIQGAAWRRLACVAALVAAACSTAAPAAAADSPPLTEWLSRRLLSPDQTRDEVIRLTETLVPKFQPPTDRQAWERQADQLRKEMLDKVVLRGVPPAWTAGPPRVEWIGEPLDGTGYRIRKLRYEALPGLWVPALLYEPKEIRGRIPATLHVNGHDAAGKAAPYKQIRCINLARRGMLALNVEWLGMGQLRSPENAHGRMNQLDLCGVSGLAPFYLVMRAGLDVLLAHEQADPQRVAVAGLSGGGWQTIYLSALDTRVTLANPVAGYSSFLTRVRFHSDLGDSEQTPNDMATVADYTHLTALRAPRPTLLTYNIKDDCCFASGHALPPLVAAARPVFGLYDAREKLAEHVNEVPGTHNFEQNNREAFYRFLADHFAMSGESYRRDEIPCADEVRKREELDVPLPADNATLHSLARAFARDIATARRDATSSPAAAPDTKTADAKTPDAQALAEHRKRLREVVRWPLTEQAVRVFKAQSVEQAEANGVRAEFWRLSVAGQWTLPAVELSRADSRGTVILLGDAGRAALTDAARQALDSGRRVVAIDPLYLGESGIAQRGYLFMLLVQTVGQRPVGIQAAQISEVARWLTGRDAGPIEVAAHGPRSSLAARIAQSLAASDAATAPVSPTIAGLKLHDDWKSLSEVIERNYSYEQAPELFCFGLLPALSR